MGDKCPIIDIGCGDLDLYVGEKYVLHIGQVSDDNTINLFLYPQENGNICESIMHEEDSTSKCTHELLVERVYDPTKDFIDKFIKSSPEDQYYIIKKLRENNKEE